MKIYIFEGIMQADLYCNILEDIDSIHQWDFAKPSFYAGQWSQTHLEKCTGLFWWAWYQLVADPFWKLGPQSNWERLPWTEVVPWVKSEAWIKEELIPGIQNFCNKRLDSAKFGCYVDHVPRKAVVVVERGGATNYWKFFISCRNKNGSFGSHQIWLRSVANKKDSTSYASELWLSCKVLSSLLPLTTPFVILAEVRIATKIITDSHHCKLPYWSGCLLRRRWNLVAISNKLNCIFCCWLLSELK